jgi:hypothetical protein
MHSALFKLPSKDKGLADGIIGTEVLLQRTPDAKSLIPGVTRLTSALSSVSLKVWKLQKATASSSRTAQAPFCDLGAFDPNFWCLRILSASLEDKTEAPADRTTSERMERFIVEWWKAIISAHDKKNAKNENEPDDTNRRCNKHVHVGRRCSEQFPLPMFLLVSGRSKQMTQQQNRWMLTRE